MKYIILYTESVALDIQKLDRVAKKRLKKKIETYLQNPLNYAKKLIRHSLGSYRWRIDNFRIIFDIDKNKIIILRVGHRKEIYK